MGRNEQAVDMVDRERGVLTKNDREYLIDPEKYLDEHLDNPKNNNARRQARFERRSQIRKRVENSLIDFAVLFHHLESDDRLGEFQNELFWNPEMGEAAEYVIAFLFSAYRNWARDDSIHGKEVHGQERIASGEMSETAIRNSFELLVGFGIAKAYSKEGKLLDEFGMHIETSETDGLDAVESRARENGDVTLAEAEMLLDAGRITIDEFEELTPSSVEE